jgi:threonine dehydrogenase-like Zn-dependent dehydrogenase
MRATVMYAAGDVRVETDDLVAMPFAYSDGTCAFCRENDREAIKVMVKA